MYRRIACSATVPYEYEYLLMLLGFVRLVCKHHVTSTSWLGLQQVTVRVRVLVQGLIERKRTNKNVPLGRIRASRCCLPVKNGSRSLGLSV